LSIQSLVNDPSALDTFTAAARCMFEYPNQWQGRIQNAFERGPLDVRHFCVLVNLIRQPGLYEELLEIIEDYLP
jgi:hypothetical protein